MNSENDEKVVSSQSWNKMAKTLHQEGYREGSSAGRDLTFQQGFDLGYLQGYEIGYKLGLHNGILRYLNSDGSSLDITLKAPLSTVQPLENPGRGLCVVCSEEGKSTKNIDSTTIGEETIIKNISDVKHEQNVLVLEKEKLLFTENYLSLLESTKLDKLFKNR